MRNRHAIGTDLRTDLGPDFRPDRDDVRRRSGRRVRAMLALTVTSLVLVLVACGPADASGTTAGGDTEGAGTTVSGTTEAGQTDEATSDGQIESSNGQLELTLDELAQYNGKDGQPAYIAVDGVIYDVSDLPRWANGEHNGFEAGQDLTEEIDNESPHGRGVLERADVVGILIP